MSDIAEPLTDAEASALHAYVESALVEMRDLRVSALGCANGLVVRERDGRPSHIIRVGTHDAVAMIVAEFQRMRAE